VVLLPRGLDKRKTGGDRELLRNISTIWSLLSLMIQGKKDEIGEPYGPVMSRAVFLVFWMYRKKKLMRGSSLRNTSKPAARLPQRSGA